MKVVIKNRKLFSEQNRKASMNLDRTIQIREQVFYEMALWLKTFWNPRIALVVFVNSETPPTAVKINATN